MTDIVVGCITGYTFDKISAWVNSLEKSGFNGKKVMICYNVGYDIVEQLTKRGFMVYCFKKNDEKQTFEYESQHFNICLDRFLHIPYFLNRLDKKEQYRYIITTDVRDVIFQKNPSEWLEKNLKDKEINITSECIRYKDEPWGNNNLINSFGSLIHSNNCNNIIYNAGVISGHFQSVLDLCDQIYLSCGRSPAFVPGGGGPDQAALNVLLNFKPWKMITNFATSESGFAAQLGTTADPSKIISFKPYLTESPPNIDYQTGNVFTTNGELYTIVHQYDRVPMLKTVIEKKYC